MIKEETINDIKSYYYVITSQLDNLELSRYLMKIPTTYFATFPYIEHYKQLQSQLATYKAKEEEYKQIISGLGIIKEHNMPNDTKFVIMAKEDYLRNLELLNEGDDNNA